MESQRTTQLVASALFCLQLRRHISRPRARHCIQRKTKRRGERRKPDGVAACHWQVLHGDRGFPHFPAFSSLIFIFQFSLYTTPVKLAPHTHRACRLVFHQNLLFRFTINAFIAQFVQRLGSGFGALITISPAQRICYSKIGICIIKNIIF